MFFDGKSNEEEFLDDDEIRLRRESAMRNAAVHSDCEASHKDDGKDYNPFGTHTHNAGPDYNTRTFPWDQDQPKRARKSFASAVVFSVVVVVLSIGTSVGVLLSRDIVNGPLSTTSKKNYEIELTGNYTIDTQFMVQFKLDQEIQENLLKYCEENNPSHDEAIDAVTELYGYEREDVSRNLTLIMVIEQLDFSNYAYNRIINEPDFSELTEDEMRERLTKYGFSDVQIDYAIDVINGSLAEPTGESEDSDVSGESDESDEVEQFLLDPTAEVDPNGEIVSVDETDSTAE